ncbi:MAG: hypothetical protein ING41_08975 [Burkholderiales bacterium]|nr:hypothetical protein [Burkholderiales bacterium]
MSERLPRAITDRPSSRVVLDEVLVPRNCKQLLMTPQESVAQWARPTDEAPPGAQADRVILRQITPPPGGGN